MPCLRQVDSMHGDASLSVIRIQSIYSVLLGLAALKVELHCCQIIKPP